MDKKIYLATVSGVTLLGLGLCIGGIFLPPLLIPGSTLLGAAAALTFKEMRRQAHIDSSSSSSSDSLDIEYLDSSSSDEIKESAEPLQHPELKPEILFKYKYRQAEDGVVEQFYPHPRLK